MSSRTALKKSPTSPASLRGIAPPRYAQTSSTFNGNYLRPNLSNGGTVPAQGDLCTSPDIWLSGTSPLVNPQATLSSSTSYGSSSSNNLFIGYDNYIYIRALNGAATNQTNTVALYYSPNAVIQWPSQWAGNQLKTDQGNLTANLINIAPGMVGVADQVFLWPNVPQPPAGSDHYCLFAQLNDANNSNPFPQIYTQLDMAALVSNNLQWGWRNTTEVSKNIPTWSYMMGLSIPSTISSKAQYFVYVNPTGFIGWTVSFTCSQVDSSGKPIQLLPTKIQQDGVLLGTSCALAPGFNAVVSIYMQNNGVSAQAGASIPLGCSYQTTSAEANEAVNLGLYDAQFHQKLKAVIDDERIGPTPWVKLGAQTYTITD
jgi:hypothetical protein